MTNEKAIHTLKSLKEYYNDKNEDSYVGFDDEDNEAVDMAIKALETQRWIPCSERLPKDGEDVLVCNPRDGMAVAYYHFDDTYYPTQFEDLNETGWFNEDDDALFFEPIAWMPLPQPYKAESEE